jgi:hypothetical protein
VTTIGYLTVGNVLVSEPEKGVSPLLLAVFRDDMLDRRLVPAADYYDDYVQVQPGQEVEILEFHAPGQVIADRLDAMGLNRATTLDSLDKLIALKAEYCANVNVGVRSSCRENYGHRRSLKGR